MAESVEHAAGAVASEPRVRIQIERGQRGTYGWSVTVRGDDGGAVLAQVIETDLYLRETYLGGSDDE